MNSGDSRRELAGWKEIAAHLKVQQRTAQRWAEQRNLPVSRTPTGRVFADPDELDGWKAGIETQPEAEVPPQVAQSPEQTAPSGSKRYPWRLVLALTLSLTAVLAVGIWQRSRPTPPSADPYKSPPRVFWQATSEHHRVSRIKLPFAPYSLVVAPSGRKAFAIAYNETVLTVIDLPSLKTRLVTLPLRARCQELSADGKILFIGSSVDGLVQVDAERETVTGAVVPTGGEIWDIAATPDGRKLFLAMRSRGLKRYQIGSGKLDAITSFPFPSFLGLDGQGNRLLVAYQGGGPKGRSGHDSVEIFDTVSEKSVGFLPELPLVGSMMAVSLDGRSMTVDGADACLIKRYDWVGCPSPPSNIMHVFRLPDLALIKSQALQIGAGGTGSFIPGGNAILLRGAGRAELSSPLKGLSVFDLDGYRFRESMTWEHDVSMPAVSVSARKVMAGTDKGDLFVFDLEPPECNLPPESLAVHLTADGVFNDVISSGRIVAHGGVSFEPGYIGQAFRFDGSAGAAFSVWGRTLGSMDSTWMSYVRFSGQGKVEIIAQLPNPGDVPSFWQLGRSEQSQIEFRLGSEGRPPVTLRSATALAPAGWHHIAITRGTAGLTLYVDGRQEAAAKADLIGEFRNQAPFQLGGGPFAGSIDELAIFSRALSAAEVWNIYESRLHEPCRP